MRSPCPSGAGAAGPTEESVLSENFAASAEATHFPVAGDFRSGDRSRSRELHSLILQSLDEDGALEIVSIDLRGRSSEADMMVVASGRSTRHVASIADKLVERLKETRHPSRAEGRQTADWVLIDAGDVITHIFRPEVREFYQIEEMWRSMPASGKPAVLP